MPEQMNLFDITNNDKSNDNKNDGGDLGYKLVFRCEERDDQMLLKEVESCSKCEQCDVFAVHPKNIKI